MIRVIDPTRKIYRSLRVELIAFWELSVVLTTRCARGNPYGNTRSCRRRTNTKLIKDKCCLVHTSHFPASSCQSVFVSWQMTKDNDATPLHSVKKGTGEDKHPFHTAASFPVYMQSIFAVLTCSQKGTLTTKPSSLGLGKIDLNWEIWWLFHNGGLLNNGSSFCSLYDITSPAGTGFLKPTMN